MMNGTGIAEKGSKYIRGRVETAASESVMRGVYVLVSSLPRSVAGHSEGRLHDLRETEHLAAIPSVENVNDNSTAALSLLATITSSQQFTLSRRVLPQFTMPGKGVVLLRQLILCLGIVSPLF